jgi:rhodanese-related sulfurtransferase
VHLEADDQLCSQVGFVLSPDDPLVLLLHDETAYQRIVYSLARVGYEQVAGYLNESLDVWQALGLPITSGDVRDIEVGDLYKLLNSAQETPLLVLDVREHWEFRQGHVPGARLIPLGELQRRLSELDPAIPIAVICEHGYRSQSAATLLGQKGFATIYNVRGGTSAWAMNRFPLER